MTRIRISKTVIRRRKGKVDDELVEKERKALAKKLRRLERKYK